MRDETVPLFPSRRVQPVVVAFRVTAEELARIDAAAIDLYVEKVPAWKRKAKGARVWYVREVLLAAVKLNEDRIAAVRAAAGKPLAGDVGKPAAGAAAEAAGKPGPRSGDLEGGKPRRG